MSRPVNKIGRFLTWEQEQIPGAESCIGSLETLSVAGKSQQIRHQQD